MAANDKMTELQNYILRFICRGWLWKNPTEEEEKAIYWLYNKGLIKIWHIDNTHRYGVTEEGKKYWRHYGREEKS